LTQHHSTVSLLIQLQYSIGAIQYWCDTVSVQYQSIARHYCIVPKWGLEDIICLKDTVRMQYLYYRREGWRHLVVLGNDHASTPREIEGDRGLVASQVVDMEHDRLRQVLLAPPDDPAQARVHQPIPARQRLYLSMSSMTAA